MLKLRKWTIENTLEGRELLHRAFRENSYSDLQNFYKWVENNVIVNIQYVRSTYDKLFKIGASNKRALLLYDGMMTDYNPGRIVVAKTIRLVLPGSFILFLLLGLLGGCVYLVKTIFGA